MSSRTCFAEAGGPDCWPNAIAGILAHLTMKAERVPQIAGPGRVEVRRVKPEDGAQIPAPGRLKAPLVRCETIGTSSTVDIVVTLSIASWHNACERLRRKHG